MSNLGVAVITGGASGIGAACARVLAARGAKVALLDRVQAEQLAAELGGRAWRADVTSEAGLVACAAAIEAEMGVVEILVNSAGILQLPVPPERLDMQVWDEVIAIDQRGTYLATKIFGEGMVRRRRGNVVNIASIAGIRSMPMHAYAPAKAAVISITQCLAAEWGPAGVRVNCVSPGYTRTPALQAAIDRGERDISALTRNAALGRMVEPEEIAKAVAFLAGPDASAITGTNLVVDCGWLVATPWNSYGGLRAPA